MMLVMLRWLRIPVTFVLCWAIAPIQAQVPRELVGGRGEPVDVTKGSLLKGAFLLKAGKNAEGVSSTTCENGELALSGPSAASLKLPVGTLIVNFPSSADSADAAQESYCDPCGHVASVVTKTSSPDCTKTACQVTVATRAASMQETVGDVGVKAMGLTAELGKLPTTDAIGCGGGKEFLTAAEASSDLTFPDPPPGAPSATNSRGLLQSGGSSCVSYPYWKLYLGGHCYFSGCHVSTSGSGYSDDCHTCSTSNPVGEGSPCNNGCTLVPDSISGVYDFADACCNHDYCYVSWFPKSICDYDFFYVYMAAHCQSRPWWQRPLCYAAASSFYSAVVVGGFNDLYHEQAGRYVRDLGACNNGGEGKFIPPGGVPDEGDICVFDRNCFGYCDGLQCRDGSPADPCATDLDCWADTDCVSGTCS